MRATHITRRSDVKAAAVCCRVIFATVKSQNWSAWSGRLSGSEVKPIFLANEQVADNISWSVHWAQFLMRKQRHSCVMACLKLIIRHKVELLADAAGLGLRLSSGHVQVCCDGSLRDYSCGLCCVRASAGPGGRGQACHTLQFSSQVRPAAGKQVRPAADKCKQHPS